MPDSFFCPAFFIYLLCENQKHKIRDGCQKRDRVFFEIGTCHENAGGKKCENLAGTGSGVYRDLSEGYRSLAVTEHILMPDSESARKYASIFEEYKETACMLGKVYGLKP